MTKRMLIDARHPEETRVAVVDGNRIEEFDFESAEHKQLKGNIYLAKVTRVEPSLQAAFVDYGGNRHGFLAFSEIHPDYYQIPKSDRDALLAEEAEHAAEEQRLREDAGDFDEDEIDERHEEDDGSDETAEGAEEVGTESDRSPVDESAVHEVRKKRQALRRRYKIQDVIQRRQVLLVQVVKEERGNKGAALTTYLSLAGRYCVLMPNTSHGGGISRKISNGGDRKRLKQIMADLDLPSTMGLIVRTAGLSRTKTEIKRDFDYLARLWDEIRDNTLKSSAPALIYRDSDLVKRAIRDLYSREIDEVMVEGEPGYKAARGFMKLLMPSHMKRVKLYDEATPVFQRFGIEDQLTGMYQPVVQLKSGGYLVINPTEALVSIDINSGRSTREHNIEQTALSTNLEAAREIARQLRLRDMAGLVVIDFIDMERSSNTRKVEKAMKDALKNDRARIQVGRISGFGLMEMSRQRLRTGMLEASTHSCPHCDGTGLMRTASSSGLSALRMVEDEAARGKGSTIVLRAGREAAIFLLNKKRTELAEVEERYGVSVEVQIDEAFEGAKMSVESQGPRPQKRPKPETKVDVSVAAVEDEDDDFDVEDEDEDEAEEEVAKPHASNHQKSHDHDDKKPSRRRRRRGGRGRRRRGSDTASSSDSTATGSDQTSNDQQAVKATSPSPGQDQGESETATADKADSKPKTRRRPSATKVTKPTATKAKTTASSTKPASGEAENSDSAATSSSKSESKTAKAPTTRKSASSRQSSTKDEVKADAASTGKTTARSSTSRSTKAATTKKPTTKASSAKPAANKAPSRKSATTSTTTKAAGASKAKTSKPDAKPASAANANKESTTADDAGSGDEPRRTGWWQKTFG